MNLKFGPVLCPKPFKTGSRWTSFLLHSTRLLPNLNLGKIHSRKSSPSSPFHKFRACGQHFLQCPLSNQTTSNPTLSMHLLRGVIPLIPGTAMQSFSSTKKSPSHTKYNPLIPSIIITTIVHFWYSQSFHSNLTTKQIWQQHLLAHQLLQGQAVAHFHPLLAFLHPRKSALAQV